MGGEIRTELRRLVARVRDWFARSVPSFIRRRLAYKFGLVFLVLGVSVAVVGGLTTAQIAADARTTAETNYAQVSSQEAEQIDTWLQQNRRLIQQTEDGQQLRGANRTAMQAYLRGKLQGMPRHIINFHIVDSVNQTVLGSTSDALHGKDVRAVDRPWARELTLQQLIRVSDPYRIDGSSRIYFAVTVRGAANRTLVMVSNTGTLTTRISRSNADEGNTYTLVTTENGTIVFDELNRFSGKSYMDSGRNSSVLATARNASGQGAVMADENARITERLQSDSYLSAYAPVSGQDWYVLTHIRPQTAFGFARVVQRFGLILTALGVIAITLNGVLFGRQIARPIDELAQKAEQMKQGDLDVDFEMSRLDNIGRLSRTFADTQRTLRQQIEEVRLIENAGDLITVLDETGTITYQSPSITSILGYEPETVVGTDLVESVHPEDRADIRKEIAGLAASETGTETRIEFRAVSADGSVRTFEGVCENLLETPFVEGIVVNSRDITERKQREQDLREANERLDSFASIVSHDLRNPLMVVDARVEYVRDDVPEEHAETIERNLDRMESMIDDLLTMARAGQTVEQTQSVALADVAREAWDHAETDEYEAQLHVSEDLQIWADRDRVLHVFENLFRNVSDHNDPPLTVWVGTLAAHDGDEGGFYVEDDGAGIPEDAREQVFDHGYTTDEGGTGFGLSIVQDVVEAHDWQIRVVEGSEGGARFEITGVETGE